MKAGLKEQAAEFTLARTLIFPDFFDFKQKQEACWVCNRQVSSNPIVPKCSQAGGRLDGRERKCGGVLRQNTTNTSCFERSLRNDLCPLQATAGKPSASIYCKRVSLNVPLTLT